MTETTSQTCSYVAEKSDPESWHGDDSEDWQLESETWSCPHTVRDGIVEEEATEQYCVFHTPPEEVPDEIDVGNAFVHAINKECASDDEDTARRKKQFIGAKFGSFTIEGETILDADDKNPIRINHSVFRGSVSFREVTFNHGIHAGGTKFSGDGRVSFARAEFSGDANVVFGEAAFSGDGDVSFRNAEFSNGGKVWFGGAEFSNGGDVSFRNADFSDDGDVSFVEATFSGDGDVKFTSADFHGSVSLQVEDFASPIDVSFANADFTGCELKVDSMAKMHLEEVDFTGVNLSGVDFSNAHLELAIFSRTVLYGAKFHGAKLDGASFGNAQMNESTEFVGNDQDSAEPVSIFYDPSYLVEVESRLHNLKRAATRYLPRRPTWSHDPRTPSSAGDKDKKEGWKVEYLQKAARTYHTLEKVGRENSLPDLQTTGFVGRQEMHRYRYAEKAATSSKGSLGYWGKWFRASIARLTLLYGESPWRVIGVAMWVILSSALLYPLGGFRGSPDGPVFKAETIPEYISMLPDSLYFSTLTFTTLGFGDFQPHEWGRWLATTETALGATLVALLVFVLGRRAAR